MQTTLDAIFKAYDVRGNVGSQLTPSLVKKIGQAFADWLKPSGKVADGHDMRYSSSEFASKLIEGITNQGVDVVDIGLVATDMLYFTVGHMKLDGGIMITASHNPPEYNGLKLCLAEATALSSENGLFEIRDLY